jgi:hypothetical protein
LRDEQALVRADAAGSLGQLRPLPKKAVPELIACLDDESLEVRINAALVLGEMGGAAAKAALPILTKALNECSTEEEMVLQKAIRKIRNKK